jgi:hypothetical protein
MSGTAHLVQMFDSTAVRAHVSAAGAKGGKTIKRLAVRVAASRLKSISRSISACRRLMGIASLGPKPGTSQSAPGQKVFP